MSNKKVIVITGPTGSGKTDISLKIAEIINGEIINSDASQFKKDLNIGTAKLDLTKTNIKHHLIDFLDADKNYSIKDFQENGRKIIDDIISRGKTPMVVGGTGLYINALLYDYNLTDDERDPNFEIKYQDVNNHDLHEMLKDLDNESYQNIHENNRRRVLRALEKALGEKEKTLEKHELLYDALILSLNTDREILYSRINKRVELMFDAGWIDECLLLKKNENIDITKIKDIGYPEVFSYLDGKLEKEEMYDIIKQKTRNYAKRQITWFKNKLNCTWIDMDYNNPYKTLETVKEIVIEFLEK